MLESAKQAYDLSVSEEPIIYFLGMTKVAPTVGSPFLSHDIPPHEFNDCYIACDKVRTKSQG